jgi:hypothetical protein
MKNNISLVEIVEILFAFTVGLLMHPLSSGT